VSTFVDTSAFIAVLDADDANHARARRRWQDLVAGEEDLRTSNYVLVETFTLAQRRLGFAAARAFQEDVVPLLSVEWIDAAAHARAVGALLVAGRRRLSLVDCASFEAMRRLGTTRVFAYDRHFAEQGFELVG
jgi:predicted nucleic acid-binding protein